MEGVVLSSLTESLSKVDSAFGAKPAETIDDIYKKIDSLEVWTEYFGEFSFFEHYHKLPLKAFVNFSFDELCKLKYSTIFMMHETVRDLFESSAPHEIVRKIMSSMWRWGMGRGTWNEIVDSYNLIRSFSLGLPDAFELRLDHSTYFNECGYSKYTRTFIDGAFAYLVYYKGVHVMTIGFSVVEGRKILIQQVQLKKPTGNRFLFHFPSNRLEYIITRFKEHFRGYSLYLITGESLVTKIVRDYCEVIHTVEKRCAHSREYIAKGEDESGREEGWLRQSEEELTLFRAKLKHIHDDQERLIAFYANAGKYRLGTPLTLLGRTHKRIT